MHLVLSHVTAHRFYRSRTGRHPRPSATKASCGMTERVAWSDSLALELFRLGIEPAPRRPLHLLFAEPGLRPSARQTGLPPLRAHVQSAELPENSILRLTEHISIVSPELCFLQMARFLSLPQLMLMGYQLCGTYALLPNPDDPAKSIVAQRGAALATAEALAAITRTPIGAHNRRARIAARHIMDNAASPMEAKLAMLLCLPTAMGGYALPRPKLNPEVPLSPEAQMLYPHATVRPDLYWADARFDVEYDGDTHESAESRMKDAARRNALEAEGIIVRTLTYAQVADDAAFDLLALRIAGELGRRIIIRMRGNGHAARRAKLRAELELST